MTDFESGLPHSWNNIDELSTIKSLVVEISLLVQIYPEELECVLAFAHEFQ